MKPVIFTCIALVIYALQSVVLEQKLAKFSTGVILSYCYPVMFLFALLLIGSMRYNNQTIVSPSGTDLMITIGMAIGWIIADAFFLGAYEVGGSLITITTIIIMFPVFASVIKYLWVGGLPNSYQIGGYVLAVLAVLLVSKGNIQTGVAQ